MEIWFNQMGPVGWTVFYIVIALLLIGFLISLVIAIKEWKNNKRLIKKLYANKSGDDLGGGPDDGE